MFLCPRSILLAASIFALTVTHSPGGESCAPRLSFKDVQFSGVEGMERRWTAVLDVDASRCRAPSGRFAIKFVRLKESAPDLEFTEQFTWQTGQLQHGSIEVSVDFWLDEAVQHYALSYVAPCACRD